LRPLLLALLLGAGGLVPAQALEQVTLQLKHHHQFQFAGYYAAVEQGYYREAGWMCAFSKARMATSRNAMWNPARPSTARARAACCWPGGRQAGGGAGVIFQHSPYALAMRQTGSEPDLRRIIGQRAMIGTLTDELGNSDELLAYLVKEGIPANSFQRVEHSYNVNDLINGKVQAMAIYTTNEPELFERRGFPTKSTVRVRSASISMATICSRAKRKLPTIRPVCGPSARPACAAGNGP
jgi:hypothetical protein